CSGVGFVSQCKERGSVSTGDCELPEHARKRGCLSFTCRGSAQSKEVYGSERDASGFHQQEFESRVREHGKNGDGGQSRVNGKERCVVIDLLADRIDLS